MIKPTLDEKRIKVAQFMGWNIKVSSSDGGEIKYKILNHSEYYRGDNATERVLSVLPHYDTDWNELMPVIDKIRKSDRHALNIVWVDASYQFDDVYDYIKNKNTDIV